jgi:hypothetical protein
MYCAQTFIMLEWVVKLQCMVYEKHEYYLNIKIKKLLNKRHFVENKTQITQHVFKML